MESEDLSLFEKFRSRVLNEVIEETKQVSACFVMVVDKKTLGFISGAISVLDLTERGVVVIESLEKPRKPLPEMDVLYFLTPSHKSVAKVISDFSEGPCYQQVHLYFTGPLIDSLLQDLARSNVLPHLKSCKEANCAFRLFGQNSFSLETPGILDKLYLCKGSSERQGLINYISQNLASLCGVLHELPYVCFQEDSLPAQEVALALEEKVEELYRKLPQLPINNSRPIMIILDRNYDLAIPLAHNVHYEALLKDLYEVGPDGNVIYQSVDNSNITSNKQAVINEFDDIWTLLKFEEIDEAQGLLNEELKNFRSRNIEMERIGDENSGIKEMVKVVSGLSNYNQKVSKFAVHRFLIDACMKTFAEEGITEITEIEQMLMTGIDTEKREYKEDQLIEKVVGKILQISNNKEKLRLAMLTLIGIELSSLDRKNISDLLPASLALHLPKLVSFGLSLQASGKSKKRLTKAYVSIQQNRPGQITKIFNYGVPRMRKIIEAALKNTLPAEGLIFGKSSPPSPEDLEQISKIQSLRKKQGTVQKTSRKVMVFVLGGVSYAELSVAKDFPEVQLQIGGTRVFSPLEFLEEIIEMSRENEISDLDPRDIQLDFR